MITADLKCAPTAMQKDILASIMEWIGIDRFEEELMKHITQQEGGSS